MGVLPDQIDRTRRLTALGMDSLMAIELKNGLETGLNIMLPVSLLLTEPSIRDLARIMSTMIGDSAAPHDDRVPASDPQAAVAAFQGDSSAARRLLERLDDLPDEQVDSMLRRLLAEQDGGT